MRMGLGLKVTNLKRPVVVAGPSPVTIVIDITDEYGGRLNETVYVGWPAYYTLTFPDDFVGTAGTSTDPFYVNGVRASGTDPIDYDGVLNVILNIPAATVVSSNAASNLIDDQYRTDWGGSVVAGDTRNSSQGPPQHISDPALILNLNSDKWTNNVLGQLNITVNNYGVLAGAGGSGGYGGALSTLSGTSSTYPVGDGGGAGQGAHPAWGTTALTQYFDATDSDPYPAGQAGSGYLAGATNKGANGAQGNILGAGAGGTSAHGISGAPFLEADAADGHAGGTAVYLQSNVSTSITGTHVTIISNYITGGGGGGGAGGLSNDGGAGGALGVWGVDSSPRVGVPAFDPLETTYGGWGGNVLWWNSSNLASSNTMTKLAGVFAGKDITL